MKPHRTPMDGSTTDDVGMMSCPIIFEHGDEANDNTPALRFYFEVEVPDMLQCDDAFAYLQSRYEQSGPEYWTELDSQDYVDGKMYCSAEFSGGAYREGESTTEWINRTAAKTNFFRVYNENIIDFRGRDAVWNHLGIKQEPV